jgi:hypothetical protein
MKKLWRDIKLVYIKLQCWWAIKRVDIKLARLDIKLRRKGLLEKKQHD